MVLNRPVCVCYTTVRIHLWKVNDYALEVVQHMIVRSYTSIR